MPSGVGPILREARNRRKVDLPTVEAATRIRVRFLLAIENEEWDVLPEGVYTRGFIRTYASYLGLDGERLAEDFRHEVEGGSAGERGPAAEPVPATSPPALGRGGLRLPRTGWIAVVAVLAVAALAVIALPSGGGGGGARRAPKHGVGSAKYRQAQRQAQLRRSGISLRLSANAEVWVCMLDARGAHLVDGQILEAGAEEGPFHSGSFTVSFGNGEVSMLIDGKAVEIPATSSPIGYSIDRSGGVTELDEAERPTCT
jgi:cytoskeleton protein RodZ